MIRNIVPSDATQVCEIYNYYIENTIVTFEETSLEVKEMMDRIMKITEKYPWIVYEENDEIIGYAYASEWKPRSAYRHSVETTVYLKPEMQGNGIGTLLYAHLIRLLKDHVHAAIGGIALPNGASIALHEKMGFQKIGQFKEVGNKFDQWIDVGYWELIL